MNKIKRSGNNEKASTQFDPFAWGAFFFTLWLILRISGESDIFQDIMSWTFLTVSCALFLSIFIPPLSHIITTKASQQIILPTIFILTPLVFALGFYSSLINMKGVDLNIGIIFGTLWIIAWQTMITRLTNKYFGIGISAIYLIVGIRVVFEGEVLGGILIMIIGVIQFLVAIRVIPVYRLPIFDNLGD